MPTHDLSPDARYRPFLLLATSLMAAILVVALQAAAFPSQASAGNEQDEAPTANDIEAGEFVSAECEFTPPEGRDPECGYLAVPADHDDPNGPQLLLHVAIYPAETDEPRPDPVVWLSGGPGEHALDVVAMVFDAGFDILTEERDLIVFDQRGTGYSQPSLQCPEISMEEVFEGADRLMAGLSECHERLQDDVDVDLRVFNSAQSAADIGMLRQALEYDEWNVFGLSYGSRLALTVMRDQPEGIRSVILDSPVPVEVSLYERVPENAQRAIDLLADSCADDPVCSDAYPDLRVTLEETVNDLNEDPAIPEMNNEDDRGEEELTGDDFVGLVFSLLYEAAVIPMLPMIIHEASERRFDTLEELFEAIVMVEEDEVFQSLGQYVAVQCQEEIAFTSQDELEAAAEEYPLVQGFLSESPLLGARLTEVCEEWGIQEGDPQEQEPVTSDIRTLILAGEFDPITPPSWGEMVEENLENAFAFTYPAMGHAVSASHPCPLQMVLAFLDDPDQEPDAGCIEEMPPVQFLPPDAELDFEEPNDVEEEG